MALTKTKTTSFDISAGSIPSTAIKALGIENASFADLAVTVDKANITGVSYPGFEEDVALLGFKIAANGSLGKYDLVDQAVDAFEDASGIDASASTNETRNASGKYYAGETQTSGTVEFETDANTKVLYHFDGDDGSTTFTDSSGNGINATANGDARLDTGSKKIGTASYEAPTSGNSFIRTAGSTSLKSTGDFTVESWVNSTYTTHSSYLDFRNPNAGLYMDWHYQGNTGRLMFCFGDDVAASTRLFDCTNIEDGNWHHVALVRDSDTSWYFYYDGVSISPISGSMTANLTKEINPDASGIYISTNPDNSGTWRGHKAEFRFSNNVRYPGGTSFTPNAGTITSYNNMTLVSNSTTAQSAPTKGDMVMTYTNGTGTAVINTDITAEFSADNGSTWTAMTLASQGTTGGHTILSAHDVTRTSTSGTSMRYRIKTLNQSASKSTRIHAVSLGWS